MKRILIVDDDANTRALLCEILSLRSCQVLKAENGQQALEILHREAVDLLITDRSMPGMDGLELLRKLSDEKNPIPVIMISAFGEERLWAQAIAFGAKDYLLKPFRKEDVLKIIDRYLL